jgi:2-oxoglutarate dehydrogenase E2 component (dihydrolipoamide succinyltransferase)
MKYEVKVPAVGESITEATIGAWMKKNGETVKRNDVLLLLETDKASVEVVAENPGVLFTSVAAGQTVLIGSVIGYIDSEGVATVAATTAAPAPAQAAPASAAAATSAPAAQTGALHADLKNHLSPAVQKVVTEKGLDPASIAGSGRDGRLTKEDVMKASPAAATTPASAPSFTPAAISAKIPMSERQSRVAMTTIRKKIAERLLHSQQSTATLTTFNEVDMTRIMEMRAKYKDQFKEKYGVSLGFMGFFIKASIEALKAFPAVNAFIEGTEIVYNNFNNIGVAVGTEKGLIVPVIKDAQLLSVAGIETAIRDFATKARDGKISLDDLSGGTFTITNGGVYGSLMSTPILNPPQSGILGMHKIQDRPMAIKGQVVVRPMMYLALSYDHRIVDGKEAVSFLVRVKEGLEDPERLLLEI